MYIREPILCFFLFIFLAGFVQAQKTNNVWAFGYRSGLNFNTSPATFLSTKSDGTIPPYYITSVCDKDGNLKFYTDGNAVWNRDHQRLPLYRRWWPWPDKVMPLLCPYPDPQNDSLYYFFGIHKEPNTTKLQYFTIRMNKSGDFDEPIYPQPVNGTSYYTTLLQDASHLLAGTTHCNQKDVWIVTHTPGALQSFLVTKNGVSPTPVASFFQGADLPPGKIDPGLSNLKFAANGERLAVPLPVQRKVVVFDFDKQNGTFRNPLNIPLPPEYILQDVELSPDASKLYVSAYYWITVDGEPVAEKHHIFQYDLNAGSVGAIEQSRFIVNGLGDRLACRRTCFVMNRAMQLGPDGKIYFSSRYSADKPKVGYSLCVIEEPNNPQQASMYRDNYIQTDSISRFINYNYIRSGSFSVRENGIQIQQKTCADQPVAFKLLYNQVDSVKWDFGDPPSGAANASTLLTPAHRYPAPGTYRASAVIYNRCFTDTAYKEVVVEPDQSVKISAAIGDTTACVGSRLTLNVSTPSSTEYLWEDGSVNPIRILDTPGRYTITASNGCSIDRREFTFRYEECPCEVYVPTAFTPNRDGLNDLFRPVVKCSSKDYKFRVYNRYGAVAFEATEINRGWNGKSGGMEAPSGVYIWLVQYRNPNTNQLVQKHGTVMLIR